MAAGDDAAGAVAEGDVALLDLTAPGFAAELLDGFDDEEIKRAITDHIESIRGVPLIKDPVEVLAASVYCEER